jgi:hypothetical protein
MKGLILIKLYKQLERKPFRNTVALLGNLRVEQIFEVGNGVQTSQQIEKIRQAMLKQKNAEFFVVLIKP